MKRNVSLPMRLCVAGGVFALVFGAAGGASLLCLLMLQRREYDEAALAGLLLVWSLLAYFPTRMAYLAVTFKRRGDGTRCDSCGYDLTGNESGVCPECGTPASARCRGSRPKQLSAARAHVETKGGPSARRRLLMAVALFATVAAASFGAAWYFRGPSADVPADLDRVKGNFCFAHWSGGSSLKDIDQDSIFAVINGRIQVRLTFLSPQRQTIGSIGVFDSAGRAWFDIDLVRERYYVHEYGSGTARSSPSPAFTYMDTDSDLLPDQRKDWSSGMINCVEDSPSWRPCESSAADGAAVD